MSQVTKKTGDSISRPPIVVIMGHIDHGKSTLLDYIRKTNVVATEAGGITQHISAYEVNHKDASGKERRITFLDTPGHEAFKGMRSRGARVADVAVLVVSAEDGVKAQTLEAYRSIKESETPFVVAINKIDKPNANIEKTKQSLSEAEIYVEGYGGDIPWVAISAKAGTGVPELLETILLVAEMEELSGNPEKPMEGVVIESRMDPKKGIMATVVITNGTLKRGGCVVAEDAYAPVRVIENFAGKILDEASFSTPIRITGWSSVPKVGATVTAVLSKKEAEKCIMECDSRLRKSDQVEDVHEDGAVVIPLIIKTDVAGSLEAIEHELKKKTHERVRLKIIGKGVGAVSEADIKLASRAEGALVIAYHIGADAPATDLASRTEIDIHHFDIIYKLTEWIDEIILLRAPHIEVVEHMGELRVMRFFSEQKERQVIGGKVLSGKITTGGKFKIMRRDAEIGEGKVLELQCQKIKTPEVGEGSECGLQVESKITIAEKDVLIPYHIVKKQ